MQVAHVELDKARAFAKNYVNFTEALLQEGLTDDQARTEARLAALSLLHQQDDARAACSVCGHKEQL